MALTSIETIRWRIIPRWSSRLFSGVMDRILLWHKLSRERRQLSSLSDRMLSDIGATRADVEQESNKPFWRG